MQEETISLDSGVVRLFGPFFCTKTFIFSVHVWINLRHMLYCHLQVESDLMYVMMMIEDDRFIVYYFISF